MVTGPGDQAAAVAAGHGRLRASRADREQVIDTLKAAFVQERLNMDELDERVGQALAARTYAELAALTDDIPTGLAAARPPGPGPGLARLRESKTAKAAVYATLAVGLVMVSAIVSGAQNPFLVPLAVVMLSPFWGLMLAGLLLLHARLDKRAARQVPRGPGPGGPGLDGQRHAGTGDDPVLPGDQADPPGAELRAHQPRKDRPDRPARGTATRWSRSPAVAATR